MSVWMAWLFAAGAGLWVLLLLGAPSLPPAAGGALYVFASLICHQQPERSFAIDGVQLPVCARCLGIYGGAALGLLAGSLAPVLGVLSRLPARRMRTLFWWTALPTVSTIAIEWAGLGHVGNVTRLAAGALVGGGAAFVVMGAVATLHYGRCARTRPSPPHLSPHI